MLFFIKTNNEIEDVKIGLSPNVSTIKLEDALDMAKVVDGDPNTRGVVVWAL